MGATIPQEQLLAELEDLLRTMPNEATIRHDTDENFSWLGRAAAIIERWNESKGIPHEISRRDGTAITRGFQTYASITPSGPN